MSKRQDFELLCDIKEAPRYSLEGVGGPEG